MTKTKLIVFRSARNGALYALTLSEEAVSAHLFNEIKKAVGELRPDLLPEFNRDCRDSETIFAFLEKHFPLPEGKQSWLVQLIVRTPGILRGEVEAS